MSNPSLLDWPVDLLILANGPGEMTTWVRPVVKALRQRFGDDRDRLRISVVLSPCSHATGKEAAIARSYSEVDRVQESKAFFRFLLRGQTQEDWDWRDRGIVIFLGGDQFFPLVISRRLGYQSLIYAEWEARWYRWIDRFAAMNEAVIKPIPERYRNKFTVIGDLMADTSQAMTARLAPSNSPTIAILPGSKHGKLAQGVPFCLAIAECLHHQRPSLRFMLPVAPTLDLTTLARYADPSYNPMVEPMGGVTAQLHPVTSSSPNFLQTPSGLNIQLITEFPAYTDLIQCQLALTTVGANTAELGSLALPMIVLLPTQQLDAMRNWDGLPGLLASLPLVGPAIAKLINYLILRQRRLFAWPNIWAGEEIVPELVGKLSAEMVASKVLDLLDYPEKLQQMRDRLLQVRGKSGAAERLAAIIEGILSDQLDQ
jgi:hypothetical protein